MTILPKTKAGGSVKKPSPRDNPNQGSFDGQSVPASSNASGWGPGVVGSPGGTAWSQGGPPVPGPSSSPRWGGASCGGSPAPEPNSKKRPAPAATASQSQQPPSFYGSLADLDRLGGPTATKRGRGGGGAGSGPSSSMTAHEGAPSSANPDDDDDDLSKNDEGEGGRGGYNSEDEYAPPGDCVQLTEEEWLEKDVRFERAMKKKGYVIKGMQEDGSCLFRAVSDQVYGDEGMHEPVREHCMNYIEQNGDYFSEFMTAAERLPEYVERKRYLGVHGNHMEIQALSEMYNRQIHIYCYGAEPINIFQGEEGKASVASAAPIRLSYHRGVHYNSIVDPHNATVGVGLGIPNYSPGSADRSLVGQAVKRSEEDAVEKTMLEDKIRATDWEATNEAIEEQVARESYLQWLRDNERRGGAGGKKMRSTATVTSGELRVNESPSRSPKPSCSGSSQQQLIHSSAAAASPIAGCSSERDSSPKPGGSSSSQQAAGFELLETATFLNGLPSRMFGLEDWSEADVLTQVLAASQQEYLDRLKQQHGHQAAADDRQPATKSDKVKSKSSSGSSHTASSSRRRSPTPPKPC